MPPTRNVVLAHGIFRFDELSVIFKEDFGLDVGPRYFDGIADFLRGHQFTVHEPAVNFAGSLARRANDLKVRLQAVLTSLPASEKIHIIGHSMGGLDARKVLAEDRDLADRVSCLTTIGTPHLGTTSADRAVRVGGGLLIAGLSRIIDLDGFRDLTTGACRKFNDAVREREIANKVRYRAVAATEDLRRTTPLLQPTWIQLDHDEGPSDGIVPLSSQRWAPTLVAGGAAKAIEHEDFPMPADHLNEVGLWDPGELLGGVDRATLQHRVAEFYLHLASTA